MGDKRFILAGLLLWGVFGASWAVDSSGDVASLELSMADRIEPIVKQIGGVSKAWVWVKIEPDLVRWQAFMKSLTPPPKAGSTRPAQIPRSIDVLPGVNTDEMAGMMKRREQSAASRSPNARGRSPDYDAAYKMASWFQRVSVRIAVPSTIAPARLSELKTKLPVLVGLQLEKGDQLVIQTVPDTGVVPPAAASPKSIPDRIIDWLSQISPNMAILWICLIAAIAFFFGPIRSFLKDAAGAMQLIRVQAQTTGSMEQKTRIREKQDVKSETLEKSRALLGGRRLALGAGTAEEPEILSGDAISRPVTAKDLFAFVNEETMTNLIQICQEETAEHVAMLASYLKPAMAGRLMSALTPIKRQEVLGHFTQESRFKPEAVTAFSKRLESTIYFVSGGPDRLLELMEEMDPAMRDAVLAELDRLLPDTARIVRSKFITYVDLFRIDRKDLQKLLWEAYRQKIALPVLFASVPPRGQEYLIQQLPDSIAEIMRSEVKETGTPPLDRVDTEGRRLVALARVLEKSGDIASIARLNSGEAA